MSIDIILAISAGLLLIAGLVGSVVPVIPGPPLSFSALICIHYSSYASVSETTFWIMGSIALVITVLDYILPIWGTKLFGGTKYGQWGSALGLVVGVITLGPFGLIVGPFAGAFLGELINNKESIFALKSAIGSTLGFLAGSVMKILYAITATIFVIISLFN